MLNSKKRNKQKTLVTKMVLNYSKILLEFVSVLMIILTTKQQSLLVIFLLILRKRSFVIILVLLGKLLM